MFVYLDNSATTKQYQEVNKVMLNMMENDFGNPSSLHRLGIIAEKAMREARRSVARSLDAKEEEVFFTSGGTESDNLALFGVCQARKRRGNKIITSKIEHPAVTEPCKRLESMGFEVVYIDVDQNGMIILDDLEKAIDENTILISVMHVNNEIGTIQPIEEIYKLKTLLSKKYDTEILLHTDAVQSYGKLPIKAEYADLISISGHKIHGPKGIGAIYISKGLKIDPHLLGGGQEKGTRSGTENIPAIVGLGKAAELSYEGRKQHYDVMKSCKEFLLQGILQEIPKVKINSPQDNCSASILNVSFLGVRGEVLLHTLEQKNIYVSTGSACSSHKKGQSSVLKAIGLSDREIEGAIRFSFHEGNTIEEMKYVLEHLKNGVSQFRKLGSFR